MNVAADRLAGRYRLVSVIATGGMGVVWEGWDERLERPVAIKQLRAVAGMPPAEAELAKRRAMREARITARLHHPHAVPVFDAVEHDGQPCLIMPLLPSTPLSDVLRERGRLPLSEVVPVAAHVASALCAAHELGIVHRDVKPGNILITADGAAHLSDFGISHAMGDATLTRTGVVHGTPAYLAPEVARGEEASFAADVFSLGSTMFAALEGAPPFGSDANSIALLHKVASGRVPPPERAGALTPFLLQMLSADPDTRPTMAQVASTLATVAVDDEPPIGPVATGPETVALPLGAMATEELEPVPADDARPEDPEPGPEPAPEREVEADPEPLPTATPPTSPSAPARGPAPRRRRSLYRPVGLAAALLLVLGLSTAALTGRLGDDAPPTGAQAETQSAPASAAASGTARQSPESTTEPTADPTGEAEQTSEPISEPSPAPTPEPEPSAGQPSEPEAPANSSARLASTITDYYALLPANTADAWPTMTPDYQQNHAGGFDSYERFWSDIIDVAVSDVEVTAPDRVVATLTYTYGGGGVDVERTAYRLVDDGGRLKIAATQVLSSRSQ